MKELAPNPESDLGASSVSRGRLAGGLMAALILLLPGHGQARSASPELLGELLGSDGQITYPTLSSNGGDNDGFFFLSDNAGGNDLWLANGRDGTLQRIPVGDSAVPLNLFMTRGGLAFYEASYNNGAGRQLRVASASSDVAVLEYPDSTSSFQYWQWNYFESQGLFFFRTTAPDGTFGTWVSDGTALGTQALGAGVQVLAFVGETTIFHDGDGDLYVGQATPTSEFLVGECCSASVTGWRRSGELAFFLGVVDGTTSLWRSDGTEDGTVRLQPLPAAAVPGAWSFFSRAKSGWFLSRNFGVGGQEADIWFLGDDAAEAIEVVDFPDGIFSIGFRGSALNDRLIIAARSDELDGAIWAVNPSAPHLVKLFDINDAWSRLSNGTGNGQYFYANDYVGTLYETDGTVAGTTSIEMPTGCGFEGLQRPMSGDDLVWQCDQLLKVGSPGAGFREITGVVAAVSPRTYTFREIAGNYLYFLRMPLEAGDGYRVFSLELDDVADLLFADTFESGDLTRWD